MKIGLRVLLGYFLIVALAALLVGRVFLEQVKPGVRQAMEGTLIDTANTLAELATDDLLAWRIADGAFARRVRAVQQRHVGAEQCVQVGFQLVRGVVVAGDQQQRRVVLRGRGGDGDRQRAGRGRRAPVRARLASARQGNWHRQDGISQRHAKDSRAGRGAPALESRVVGVQRPRF